MNRLNTKPGISIDRRAFAKAGLAALGLAGVSMLEGCSVLGIEDPNAKQNELSDDPGVVNFERLEVRFNIEPSSWQWSVIDDVSSQWNGYLVVSVPVAAVNGDDTTRVMSSMYCKVYGPDGAQQEDLAQRYPDDILNTGSMSSGASANGQLHILFRGAGTYTVRFDTLLGRKTSFDLNIAYNEYTAAKPFPTNINEYNANYAVPQGETFDVSGLTIELTSDASTYSWSFISAQGDEYWDGRGTAGIPIRVTNNTSAPLSFSSIAYQTYSYGTYQLADASWAYPDSARNSLSVIQPNQSVISMLYVVYEASAVTCYCVFCNDGLPVVAGIWIP